MHPHRLYWLAGALVLGVCGDLAQPAPAAVPSLRVRKLLLKPNSVPGSGGLVSIRASVTEKGARVLQVRAQAQIGTQKPGAATTLTGKGSVFSGTVQVPANLSTTPGSAAVLLSITTSQGSEQATLGTVSVGAGSDTGPPAPPPN